MNELHPFYNHLQEPHIAWMLFLGTKGYSFILDATVWLFAAVGKWEYFPFSQPTVTLTNSQDTAFLSLLLLQAMAVVCDRAEQVQQITEQDLRSLYRMV